ncbi:hypothetical protein ABID58_005526 [Bradyrhizobium sp. S3.2.6]|uniref:hypothetical protein n=1 Tax=Bradyrhizobium sp. S3.2.6 TaxID=3156428 RepID=UPI0033989999
MMFWKDLTSSIYAAKQKATESYQFARGLIVNPIAAMMTSCRCFARRVNVADSPKVGPEPNEKPVVRQGTFYCAWGCFRAVRFEPERKSRKRVLIQPHIELEALRRRAQHSAQAHRLTFAHTMHASICLWQQPRA